jgi:hypothetical protein
MRPTVHSFLNIIGYRLILSCVLLLSASKSLAETAKTFGDYQLHYNAFHSVDVSPEAVRAHRLKRGPNIGMLNISLLKKMPDGTTRAEKANIRVKSQNLVGQIKNLEVKPIVEPGALYYIAHFRFANEETYRFNVYVTPESEPAQTFNVSFLQKFYQGKP